MSDNLDGSCSRSRELNRGAVPVDPTARRGASRPRGKRASDKPAGGARKNLRLSCFCCVPELAQPVPVMVAVRGKALVSELLGELTAAAAPQLGSRIFEFLQVFDCNSVVTVDPSTPVEWVRQTGTQIFAICQQPWVPGADGGADGAGAYAAPPENNTAYLPPGVAYAGGPPISAAMGAEAYPISAEQAYGNAPMSPMSPHSPYGYYDAGYDAGYEYGYDGVAYAPMSPMGHSPMSPMAPPLPPMWVNMANGGAVGGAPPIAAPPPARRDEPPAPAFEGERAELDAAMAFARSVPKEVREMRGRELADAKADHVGARRRTGGAPSSRRSWAGSSRRAGGTRPRCARRTRSAPTAASSRCARMEPSACSPTAAATAAATRWSSRTRRSSAPRSPPAASAARRAAAATRRARTPTPSSKCAPTRSRCCAS